MTQPAKSQEPSMEEILASIRRIIADDDASKGAQRRAEMVRSVPPATSALPQSSFAPIPSVPFEPSPQEARVGEADAGAAAAGDGLQDRTHDVLDLTESIVSAEPSESASVPGPLLQFRNTEDLPDASSEESEQQPPAMPRTVEQQKSRSERRASALGEREQLLSSATSAAVDSAFTALTHTILVQNARTLDDLVREMLQPMLKSWLDDNLPGMVERLVRAEIERVARGR